MVSKYGEGLNKTALDLSDAGRRLTIAIDGPAGVGKSAVSARIAEQLGYVYLDTGALYRAVTLAAIRSALPLGSGEELADFTAALDIRVERPRIADGRQYTVTLDGEDVTWLLSTPEVDRHVSQVSAHAGVRRALLDLQRSLASGGVVMAGRDIGTVVAPDADVKVFLTATPETRARRRYDQLRSRGMDADLSVILSEIIRRDDIDSSRAAAPLRPADDAAIVVTDGLSIDEEVALIIELCRRALCLDQRRSSREC
jgi:cytidylate kinase